MSMQRIDDIYMKLVRRMPLRPITTIDQHKRAIDVLIELGIKDHSMNRDERDYYQVLSNLVKDYEETKVLSRKPSSPQEILRYLMKEHNCKQADLVPLIGHKSNLSAFLAGKRNLSKAAAIELGERFNIDPRLFLPPLQVIPTNSRR